MLYKENQSKFKVLGAEAEIYLTSFSDLLRQFEHFCISKLFGQFPTVLVEGLSHFLVIFRNICLEQYIFCHSSALEVPASRGNLCSFKLYGYVDTVFKDLEVD